MTALAIDILDDIFGKEKVFVPSHFHDLLLPINEADLIKSISPLKMITWDNSEVERFNKRFSEMNLLSQELALFVFETVSIRLSSEWSSEESFVKKEKVDAFFRRLKEGYDNRIAPEKFFARLGPHLKTLSLYQNQIHPEDFKNSLHKIVCLVPDKINKEMAEVLVEIFNFPQSLPKSLQAIQIVRKFSLIIKEGPGADIGAVLKIFREYANDYIESQITPIQSDREAAREPWIPLRDRVFQDGALIASAQVFGKEMRSYLHSRGVSFGETSGEGNEFTNLPENAILETNKLLEIFIKYFYQVAEKTGEDPQLTPPAELIAAYQTLTEAIGIEQAIEWVRTNAGTVLSPDAIRMLQAASDLTPDEAEKERAERDLKREEEEQEQKVEARWEKITASAKKTEEVSTTYAGKSIGKILDRIENEKLNVIVKKADDILSIISSYDGSPYRADETISSQKLAKKNLFDTRTRLYIYRDQRRPDRVNFMISPAPSSPSGLSRGKH